MKGRLLTLIATGILGLTIITTVHAERAQPKNIAKPIGHPSSIPGVLAINASEVVKLADYDEEMVIFDARSTAERKKGNIRWSEGFQPKQLTAQRLADTLASKSTVVVFYGNQNSRAAAQGAKIAASKGYKSVYWLKGGWSEWSKSGLRLDM